MALTIKCHFLNTKKGRTTTMTLNKEFKFVFSPKNTEDFGGRRRFAIGAGSLHKYVGEKNAEVVIRRAIQSKDDRTIVKFRTKGAVYVYAH